MKVEADIPDPTSMVSTTRTYNDSRNLARTGLGYDGVVRITNGSFYGKRLGIPP